MLAGAMAVVPKRFWSCPTRPPSLPGPCPAGIGAAAGAMAGAGVAAGTAARSGAGAGSQGQGWGWGRAGGRVGLGSAHSLPHVEAGLGPPQTFLWPTPQFGEH